MLTDASYHEIDFPCFWAGLRITIYFVLTYDIGYVVFFINIDRKFVLRLNKPIRKRCG